MDGRTIPIMLGLRPRPPTARRRHCQATRRSRSRRDPRPPRLTNATQEAIQLADYLHRRGGRKWSTVAHSAIQRRPCQDSSASTSEPHNAQVRTSGRVLKPHSRPQAKRCCTQQTPSAARRIPAFRASLITGIDHNPPVPPTQRTGPSMRLARARAGADPDLHRRAARWLVCPEIRW
jgi:hypothetical protein